MMAGLIVPQVTERAQPDAWPALQRELEAFLNTQRRSLAREDARMALWDPSPRDAWRRLDAIASRQASTPAWLYELQDRIRPLLALEAPDVR